ncbi:hypothetical protein PG984_012285 [Apiospora sp. TS-2023a]
MVFSFKPSRPLPAGSMSDEGLDVAEGKTHTGNAYNQSTAEARRGRANDIQGRLAVPSTLDVFASRYTGDAFLEGIHSAKLTVIHDPNKQSQPLYRWMHLFQHTLDLEKLSAEIMKIESLSNAERHSLAKLFTEVKRKAVNIRHTAEGTTVQHMEPMPFRVPIGGNDSRPIVWGPGAKPRDKKYVTWLCIPYFSLETYTGLLSGKSGSSEFPVETLLQSKHTRTPKARELQQVVYQRGQAGGAKCFHVPQLWCIIIDKSLIITCGRLPSTALKENIISLSTEPPTESPHRGKMIYVSYYEAVLWELSLEESSTWFGFMKVFSAFWPRPVRIFHRDRVVIGDDWPRILHTAKHSNTPLTLILRVGYEANLLFHFINVFPSAPTIGVLQSPYIASRNTAETSGQSSKAAIKTEKTVIGRFSQASKPETFHVFTWLDPSPLASQADEIVDKTVTQQLKDIDDYLMRSTKRMEQSAYRRCEWSTPRLVHAYLEDQGQDVESHEDTDRKQQYYQRVDIYNAAELAFQFFLPAHTDQDAPTVGKFWDAILSLVEMPEPTSVSRDDSVSRQRREGPRPKKVATPSVIHVVRTKLRVMVRKIIYFQGIIKHIPPKERQSVFIPDALVHAWLHLLMALIMSSKGVGDWDDYLDVSEKLIQKGTAEIISSLPTVDLVEHTTMQPLELAALITWKLLQDSTDEVTSLTYSYSEYMKDLDNMIRTSPNRSHQSRLTSLKEEIEIIRYVVKAQRRMAMQLQSHSPRCPPLHARAEAEILQQETRKSKLERAGRDPDDRYHPYSDDFDFDVSASVVDFKKLSPTDPNGLLGLLIGDCKSWLERRDREFGDMDAEASRLEAMNANQIDTTKDRQEAAVYAFTMVTIVFLPLGTISSIFGMNTSDIANLELGQWVYWATALPVTVLVIVLGLWWMGELRNLVDWVLRRRVDDEYGSVPRYSRRAQRPAPPHSAPGLAGYYSGSDSDLMARHAVVRQRSAAYRRRR